MLTKLVTAPTALPVTVAEAKDFLRIEHSSEDETITRFIRAATSACERAARISFMRQTWEASYQLPYAKVSAFGLGGVFSGSSLFDPDGINKGLALPFAPVAGITTFNVSASTGEVTPVTDIHYALSGSMGNVFTWNDSFRDLLPYNGGTATIRYTTGYTDKAEIDAKGADLTTAVLMTVAVIYEHRGLSNVIVPPAARELLANHWSSPTY